MSAAVDAFFRFANLFSEPILLVSNGARLLGANSPAQRMFLSHGESVARSLCEIVEDAPDRVLEYLRLCSRTAQPLPGLLTFRGGNAFTAPTQYRCAGCAFRAEEDDQERLIVLRMAPKGVSNQFVALNQQIERLRIEVARRRQAERAEHEKQELLRVTLASIGDAVITTDLAGNVVFMNGVAESLTGWRLQDAVSRPLEQVFVIRNESSRMPLTSPVRRVLKSGRIVGLANHTVLVRKDGTDIPIDDSGAPIRDSAGELLGVVLVFHDVSERRRLEHELIRQREALREIDRSKDEFLAMLAHELRNPLAPLRNCLQILRTHGRSPVDTDRLVGMMERQTNQLVRLVDDLLDVARITRGTIALKREQVGLRAAVDQAVETSRPLVDARHHRLRIDLPGGDLFVDADPVRLVQVISNILTNAAKFTNPGGDIVIAAWQEEERVVVSVRDSGIGLHPASISRIFDMFRQEDKSLDRTQGGLGIGLAVVKKLLIMHGGDITAHSEGVGRGAEFRFWLPIAHPAEALAPGAASPATSPDAARVLIVDDNADGAESLAMLLRTWGCDVRVVADGHAALELVARAPPPHAILLDIGLPGMNGYEVARQLRLRPGLGAVRLIAITGYGSEIDRARSHEAGFNAHLTKPVDLDELQRLLSA